MQNEIKFASFQTLNIKEEEKKPKVLNGIETTNVTINNKTTLKCEIEQVRSVYLNLVTCASMLEKKTHMIPVCNMCNEPHSPCRYKCCKQSDFGAQVVASSFVVVVVANSTTSNIVYSLPYEYQVKQIAIARNSRFHASYLP